MQDLEDMFNFSRLQRPWRAWASSPTICGLGATAPVLRTPGHVEGLTRLLRPERHGELVHDGAYVDSPASGVSDMLASSSESFF